MGWRLAVANQKGGVGKTTTVHSLGYALAERGRHVLLVDLDPQACLTYSVGLDPDALETSLHDVLVRRGDPRLARRPVPGVERLSILPANVDLAAAEIQLLTRPGREYILGHALSNLDGDHDVVLIDCPPSLGVLTINALTAAHDVLIPFQCEALSTRGVHQLLEMIEDVRAFTNAALEVRGGIATMFDRHTNHNRAMLDEVADRHGIAVLSPPVRKSVRFPEAPGRSRCILQHAPQSAGAEAYRSLALQLDLAMGPMSRPGAPTEGRSVAPTWQEQVVVPSL
jgi:chromosome partitioning protein